MRVVACFTDSASSSCGSSWTGGNPLDTGRLKSTIGMKSNRAASSLVVSDGKADSPRLAPLSEVGLADEGVSR